MGKMLKKILDEFVFPIVLGGIIFAVYSGTLAGVQYLSLRNSPRITHQKQLELLIEKEKEKLGCDKKIAGSLHNFEVGKSFKEDDYYKIKIGGKFGNNESVLGHEVYHICDGHVDFMKESNLRGFYYWLYAEPKATLYQIGVIK